MCCLWMEEATVAYQPHLEVILLCRRDVFVTLSRVGCWEGRPASSSLCSPLRDFSTFKKLITPLFVLFCFFFLNLFLLIFICFCLASFERACECEFQCGAGGKALGGQGGLDLTHEHTSQCQFT